MSSTRHAADGTPFRQERYCSSPAYQPGLYAMEVSKRCSVLKSPKDRELIWAVQRLSWSDGGLPGLAANIIACSQSYLGTESMHTIGIDPQGKYNAGQVRKIRREMPDDLREEFLVEGEMTPGEQLAFDAECARRLRRQFDALQSSGNLNEDDYPSNIVMPSRPDSIATSSFLAACRSAAENFARDLMEICLNPERDLWLWYLPELRRALRSYFDATAKEARARSVTTKIGLRIEQALDYCLDSGRLVLLNGPHFTGKGFAAKAWAAQRPGRAVVYDVPSSNDDIGFFSGLARAIGVSVESTPKAHKVRDRVERVLQTGDLMVILNRAHYCWPQSNNRKSKPTRLSWVLSALVEKGVHVALVTTPAFFQAQREVELQLGWLRGQLINPVDYVPLPEALDESDLRAVAIHLLQTADEESIHAAVNFSIASCKGLAGIEAIVSRATYFAKLAGRSAVARNDIRAAIKAVIPAENALRTALGDNPLDVRVSTGGAPPAESGSTAAAHGDERPGSNRILQPTPPETSNRERGENAGIVSAIA